MTEAAPRPRRSWTALFAAGVALGLIALLAGIYLARRQVASRAVTGWLASKGIASESTFQELGPGRLVGRIRIGRRDAPDLVVSRAEVRYSLGALLSGRGVQITSIRLTRPQLRARLQDGRFSAGALDPLIDEFRSQPPKPGQPHPRVEVDDGRLLLATDYGTLAADVSALVTDARLMRLDARTKPTRLAGRGVAAELGAADLQARTRGEQLSVSMRAPFGSLRTPTATVQGGEISLVFSGTYPDLARRVTSRGAAIVGLQARSAQAQGMRTGPLTLRVRAPELSWTLGGAQALSARIAVSGEAHDLGAAGLRIVLATATGSGEVNVRPALRLRLAGRADVIGGWRGLGPPSQTDSREIVAVKRGLAAFRASADGLSLQVAPGKAYASIEGPVRLLPQEGGEIRLAPAGAGWRLTSSGGGLPRLSALAQRASLAGGVLTAEGSGRAGLSIGPLKNAEIALAGALRVGKAGASITSADCGQVKALALDLGQTRVEGLAGRLCPLGQPLLRTSADGFSLAARVEGGTARVPAWQATLDNAAGTVSMAQTRGRVSARIEVAAAKVEDAAKATRFRPLVANGEVQLARDVWSGAFDARLAGGPPLAHAVLRHDGRAGAGALDFRTGRLAFAPGGLQPRDLSPLVEPLGTNVTGAAEFSGRIVWGRAGATSTGVLAIRDVGSKSPLGEVSGASGDIRFTSLAPPIAPPGQLLTAQKVAAPLALTGLSANLELQEKALILRDGEAAAGGGRVRLPQLVAPLSKDQAITGEVVLQGVQLHDLVDASPFGDRVELDARVSGHIPFALQAGHVQVAGGALHAVAPGRLSIRRDALRDVSAKGSLQAPGPPGPAPGGQTDTFTDFAYQALENLAYDKLDAGVATRSDGRLGVMFHIVGRHDPPKHQEITLSWMDVLRRRFLGKKLPLPSGTGVDLTLDTTLNLDELLKDYTDFNQLRSSPSVQR